MCTVFCVLLLCFIPSSVKRKMFVFIHFCVFVLFSPAHLSFVVLLNLFCCFLFSFPSLSCVPPFPLSSSSSRVEEHGAMYLMVPKPLDSFNLLKVKGKVLKQKVLHASCEWYVPQVDVSDWGWLT